MKLKAGDVIVFDIGVLQSEIDFDAGQKARIVRVEPAPEKCLQIFVDFKEFEDFNKSLAEANYYDSNGVACLKWYETNLYPSNCKTSFFVDEEDWPFVLESEAPVVIRLSGSSWERLVSEVGADKLAEWGVKPL